MFQIEASTFVRLTSSPEFYSAALRTTAFLPVAGFHFFSSLSARNVKQLFSAFRSAPAFRQCSTFCWPPFSRSVLYAENVEVLFQRPVYALLRLGCSRTQSLLLGLMDLKVTLMIETSSCETRARALQMAKHQAIQRVPQATRCAVCNQCSFIMLLLTTQA